jgi:TetR/AcrR family transcriptional regulator
MTDIQEPPRKNAADADTERRILDAARHVFTSRGTAGARMQEIAAVAGVNQALLHYYFRSKDALALAVFREAAARLFPVLMRILSEELPLEERVTRVVHHYISTLREHPYLPGYVLAEINFDRERIPALARDMGALQLDLVRGVLRRLDADLAQRAAAGEIRRISAEQFIANVASLCVFPFAARPMLQHVIGLDDWDAFLVERERELPGFILNALRP